MANCNDFKLLKKKSLKYFNLVNKEISFSREVKDEVQKERIGFYFFILEAFSGKNLYELAECITDTDFLKYYTNSTCDDCGVDAVLINEEEKSISLFNFKYRNKFQAGHKQGLNDTLITSKYTNALLQENIGNIRGKPREFAKKIIDRFASNDIWSFQLYVVSNDDQIIDVDDMHIKCMKEAYELDVIPVGLQYISDMMSIRPEPVNSSLILDHDAIMSFSENNLSSSMSYIARVKLSELIRITCNDKSLRDNYNIEDLTEISNVDLNYDVLFDNVRGFVVKSKYNKNIFNALKEEPEKFFMYNNGITICATSIISKSTNAKKKQKLDLKGIQILNGGQTLRTIHQFNNASLENMDEYLSDAEILVRFFVAENDDYKNKIAEYTNSQNAISYVDLKSLSSEQIAIEQYLDEHDIIYSRKNGDTGVNDNKDYKYKISMEKFGQLLLSKYGFPEKCANQKQLIFGKLYNELFIDNFDIDKSTNIIEQYFEIKKEYHKHAIINSSEQKYYYILYVLEKHESIEIYNLIMSLEDFLTKNQKRHPADSRVMLKLSFKNEFDKYLNQKYLL